MSVRTRVKRTKVPFACSKRFGRADYSIEGLALTGLILKELSEGLLI